MARPVNADAEATHYRILDAACALIEEDGPAALSTRGVARRAGVSVATVHHYFGNKEGLVDACIEQWYSGLAGLAKELPSLFDKGASFAELAEHAVRTGFRYARKHQAFLQLLLISVVQTGGLDRRRHVRAQVPFLRHVSMLAAPYSRWDVARVRRHIQSVVVLSARYAVSTEKELAFILGEEHLGGRSPVEGIEDHLVELILLMDGAK